MTPPYTHHLFFCCNKRENGTLSCANFGSIKLRDYAKSRIKKLPQKIQNHTRINIAGCLGACLKGPIAVMYPEDIWYTFVDKHDVDEIIDSHIVNGVPVKRLIINPKTALK